LENATNNIILSAVPRIASTKEIYLQQNYKQTNIPKYRQTWFAKQTKDLTVFLEKKKNYIVFESCIPTIILRRKVE